MKAVFALSALLMVVGAFAANDAVVRLFSTSTAPSASAGGFVTFQDVGSGNFNISFDIWGLPANTAHAAHVHQWGDNTIADGTGTGLHFNPAGAPHSCSPNATRHAGDILGSFSTDANGNYRDWVIRDLVSTVGNGATDGTDTSIIGRGFIVHANADDCVTQPTGNAGARWLQGTIGIAEGATNSKQSFKPSTSQSAVAVLYNNAGSKIGQVWMSESAGGVVTVNLKATGFAAGSVHGIHVHVWGDHSRLDATSAGGHFNPNSKQHALTDEWGTERHVGDLGNVVAGADGTLLHVADYDLLTVGGTLNSNVVGHAFVIHSKNDEGSLQQPTGNAGSRPAMGVLGVSPLALPTPEARPYAVVGARVFGTANRPSVAGTVKFSSGINSKVNVECALTGLPPSTALAMHIHEFGDLSSDLGLATGGHFNPHGALHGCPPNGTRHAGDIGTFTTDASGNFAGTISINALMAFSGANSTVGRGVIIHATFDNCGQPLGNAGSRLAQGVIGILAPPDGATTQTAVNPSTYTVSPWTILRAVINPTSGGGNTKGWAFFRTSPSDSTVTQVFINITGANPVSVDHAVHVHTWGDLTATDGTSAGGHWNPDGVTHALPQNATHHQGDMGNMYIDANGNGLMYGEFHGLTISNIVGRAIIFHAGPDKGYDFQPTGDAGARYGYGVIGVSALTNADIPVWPSSTGGDCIGDDCSPAVAVQASLLAVLLAALLAIVLARF